MIARASTAWAVLEALGFIFGGAFLIMGVWAPVGWMAVGRFAARDITAEEIGRLSPKQRTSAELVARARNRGNTFGYLVSLVWPLALVFFVPALTMDKLMKREPPLPEEQAIRQREAEERLAALEAENEVLRAQQEGGGVL